MSASFSAAARTSDFGAQMTAADGLNYYYFYTFCSVGGARGFYRNQSAGMISNCCISSDSAAKIHSGIVFLVHPRAKLQEK
jgi:hypothetical protein